MNTRKNVLPFIILFILMLVSGAVAGLASGTKAFAADPIFSVKQTEEVVYCGESFIYGGKFASFDEKVNPLYEATEFTVDGKAETIPATDISFSADLDVKVPKTYSTEVYINYNGKIYTVPVSYTVSQKELIVSAKINGLSYVEIDEGEEYYTSVEYEGFVNGENESVLDAPAIIQNVPKLPTTGFTVVPVLASSSLYRFTYVGAVIVINPNPDKTRTVVENGATLLTLTGSFSPYYTLEFVHTGINKADVTYAAISEKIDKYYDSIGLFDEYRQTDAFVINMYLDGDKVDITENVNVSIKLEDSATGKKTYRVVHFADDGTYSIINAAESKGYLNFKTVGFGQYVVLTPIEGANTVTIVALCVVGVAVVLLVVILFAVFRRKY